MVFLILFYLILILFLSSYKREPKVVTTMLFHSILFLVLFKPKFTFKFEILNCIVSACIVLTEGISPIKTLSPLRSSLLLNLHDVSRLYLFVPNILFSKTLNFPSSFCSIIFLHLFYKSESSYKNYFLFLSYAFSM